MLSRYKEIDVPITSLPLSGHEVEFPGVLRIYRRHEKRCSLTSKADPNCPSKVKCPVWVKGRINGGPLVERSLQTRNWTHAAQKAMEMESGDAKGDADADISLTEAVELFRILKGKKSADLARKVRRLTDKLLDFTQRHRMFTVRDVDYPALIRFRNKWTGAESSRRRDQEILRGFFKMCVKSGWILNSPAADLDAIPITTPQTDVFTHEELKRIMEAARVFPDSYGRTDTPLARQVYAFVLVMRYTGLSIGDVAGLPKAHVQGNRVMTRRDKTGKEVYVPLPGFVVYALAAAPHDSDDYFFWSGNGKIHTRASKWNTRLQKLFVLAGIRPSERKWNAKGLRTANRPPMRPYSDADPRWFRHSLARDLLENGVTLTEVSEILGNTEEVCRKHYSKWDKRRQALIDEKLSRIWAAEIH